MRPTSSNHERLWPEGAGGGVERTGFRYSRMHLMTLTWQLSPMALLDSLGVRYRCNSMENLGILATTLGVPVWNGRNKADVHIELK